MPYLPCDQYAIVYAKYIASNRHLEMIDAAGDLHNKTVYDLCCGNGRLAIAAFDAGAKEVIGVDEERRMMPSYQDHKVHFVSRSVENFLGYSGNYCSRLADVIFCQQGVNYWLNEQTIKDLTTCLQNNGQFIFNTFNFVPNGFPHIKHYEFNGRKYTEIICMLDKIVYHTQIVEYYPPHHTQFKWITAQEFKEILSPYFTFNCRFDNNTTIYNCIKN